MFTKEEFYEFAQTEVGKWVVIVAGSIVLAIYILAYTPIGTKALKGLREKAENATKKTTEMSIDLDKFKTETNKNVEEFKHSTTEKVDAKLEISSKRIENLERLVLDSLHFINNVKVKQKVETYENEQLTTNEDKVSKIG